MQFIYNILIAINILGFILMGYDKLKAKNRGWRIPELNLFIVAFLGGAAGIFLGMQLFRHKTKHYSYMLGIPLLFCLNVLAVLAVRHFV